MMRILKQLLFITIFSACLSLTAMAQDREGKKVPPKDKPPIVLVEREKKGEKPKENERPRDDDRRNDNRGKRPGE